MDETAVTLRRLTAPRGLQVVDGTELLSADGRHVAALVDPAGDFAGQGPTNLAVWNVDTGRVQLLGTLMQPIAWAPDGSVLIVNTDQDAGSSSSLPLGYWTPGARSIAPIRIPITDASQTVTVLPAD